MLPCTGRTSTALYWRPKPGPDVFLHTEPDLSINRHSLPWHPAADGVVQYEVDEDDVLLSDFMSEEVESAEEQR